MLLSDSTPGAVIHYTTDGSAPTAQSAVYSAPISVSATETLRAIAIASGYAQGSASATYTISQPVLAAPAFTPAAGTFTTPQMVTLSSMTGASIYYTTDGSSPSISSPKYSGPITVAASETISAIAAENGYAASPVASAAYVIDMSTTPMPAASTTSLTISPSGALTAGESTTLMAKVVGSVSGPAPTGTVQFSIGTLLLGPAPVALNGAALATLTLTNLPSGNDAVTATYSGDANYMGSTTSAQVSVGAAAAPSFTLSLSATTINLAEADSGSTTVSVKPQSDANAQVIFACSGLPANATCTFAPASVALSGGAVASTTLTVSLNTQTAAYRPAPILPGETVVALVPVGCLAVRRRSAGRHGKVRRWSIFGGLGLAVLMLGATLSGCGGSASAPIVSASIAHTVTVTATAGSEIQQTTFTLLTN